MAISTLNINNFRNFSQIKLDFVDGCNMICGENGSGKTSILEAIYYLILGKSFRTHLVRRIIKYEFKDFSIFSKFKLENGPISVGITKSIETGKQVKIDGKESSSIIDVTKLIPIQLLNHNSYFLLYEGPKTRRQFIDWGLFHVEHSFLDIWRKVERALEQRNIAIRKKYTIDNIKIWDSELIRYGIPLSNFREQYINNFLPIAQEVLSKILYGMKIEINYYPGWDTKNDLALVLHNNLLNDQKFGYTTIGPHRSDIQILVNNIPAKDALSRGQQKLLVYGLQIAQAVFLCSASQKGCIYLVDDLAAELDFQKCKLLANLLLEAPKSQIFVTGLDYKYLEQIFTLDNKKTFHLNNKYSDNRLEDR